MHLPSFLWLWRLAAWSMGFSLLAYVILAISGAWMASGRLTGQKRSASWAVFHLGVGSLMIVLVLVLLAIGVVGTLGHYGSLGHSSHLASGLAAVVLTLASGWSALQISSDRPWARSLHIAINVVLFWGFVIVTLTGWAVVQKYLP